MGILDSILSLFGGKKETPAAAAPRPAQPLHHHQAAAAPAGKRIDRVLVGESLVGDGNEVAHVDLIMGPRGSAAEKAFANALSNNKDGFTTLLAVVAPNLLCKPNTVMFNKVTIKGAKQAVQMFGPAQRAVAMARAPLQPNRSPGRCGRVAGCACSPTSSARRWTRARSPSRSASPR